MKEKYSNSVQDLEKLVNTCILLSNNTHERKVATWREEYGSYIFAKLCVHSIGILKLVPESSLFNLPNNFKVWDIASLSVLVRTVIETYNVFYYLIIDEVDDNELEFRFLLWRLHSECERKRMLNSIGSTNPKIKEIENDIEEYKSKLLINDFYKSKNSNERSSYRRGETGIALTNSQISERAGISINFYKSTYRYLSSYVHTFPFSIQQIAVFKADDEESLSLIKTLIDTTSGYLSFVIRDFVKLFPDQKEITKEVDELTKVWLDVLNKLASNIVS
jgi:hypothetical protein